MNVKPGTLMWMNIMALLAIIYALGAWLEGLYGLDPPEIYFFIGFLLRSLAFLGGIICVVILLYRTISSFARSK